MNELAAPALAITVSRWVMEWAVRSVVRASVWVEKGDETSRASGRRVLVGWWGREVREVGTVGEGR